MNPAEPARLVTLEEAARMLGTTGAAVMAIVKAGNLRPVMKGWQQRFRATDIAELTQLKLDE